jgi:copper chaperone CopZ
MSERTIAVGGMNCGGCEKRVEEALGDVDGVLEARADRGEGRATVSLAEGADPNLEAAIDELGFDFLGWR